MSAKKANKLIVPGLPKKGHVLRWLMTRVGVFIVLFVAVAIIGGILFKDTLIFHPSPDYVDKPSRYKADYQTVDLTTEAGEKLKAWYVAAPDGDADTTVIVLQGNSRNMSLLIDRLVILRALRVNSIIVDYPGYGDSPGSPSEEATYRAAEAVWQWVVKNKTKPDKTIIYGYSLGGGAATWLAEKHPPAGLILDSSFTRLQDVPTFYLPWLTSYFNLVLGDAYDNEDRLSRIKCPLLVIHSRDDEIVPFIFGQRLYDSYEGGPKTMVAGSGNHIDFTLNLFPTSEDTDGYKAALQNFFNLVNGRSVTTTTQPESSMKENQATQPESSVKENQATQTESSVDISNKKVQQ